MICVTLFTRKFFRIRYFLYIFTTVYSFLYRALFSWWRMAICAGVQGEFCQNLPEPIFLKKKKKKLPVNVLGVVLRYLLTKIFLAAKYAD